MNSDARLNLRRNLRRAVRYPAKIVTLRDAGSKIRAAHRVALSGYYDSMGLGALPPRTFSDLDLVVDVGANEGWWSWAILTMGSPRSLLAFEPVPELAAACRRTLRRWPQVTVLEAACADSDGTAVMHVNRAHQASSLLPARPRAVESNPGLAAKRDVRVRTLSLDNLAEVAERTVGILKIDVQGAELSVLSGASALLARTRLVIVEMNLEVEYEGGSSWSSVHSELSERGFQLAPIVRESG